MSTKKPIDSLSPLLVTFFFIFFPQTSLHFLNSLSLKLEINLSFHCYKSKLHFPSSLLHTKPLSSHLKEQQERQKKKLEKMDVPKRKPYFIEEEADMEAGVSSPSSLYKNMNRYHPQSYYNYHQYSPRSVVVPGKFHDFRFDHSSFGQQSLPHFLDSCSLCKKRLGNNRDIFMYRYVSLFHLDLN